MYQQHHKCLLEFLGSNLGRDTGYSDWRFSWFCSVHRDKCWDSFSIRPHPLPFKSLQIVNSQVLKHRALYTANSRLMALNSLHIFDEWHIIALETAHEYFSIKSKLIFFLYINYIAHNCTVFDGSVIIIFPDTTFCSNIFNGDIWYLKKVNHVLMDKYSIRILDLNFRQYCLLQRISDIVSHQNKIGRNSKSLHDSTHCFWSLPNCATALCIFMCYLNLRLYLNVCVKGKAVRVPG
jgi:hypothetical protein